MSGEPFHNQRFWDGVWELPGPWVDDAACAVSGFPDAWFPDKDDVNSAFAAATAKRVCRGCPVRWECLDYAMRHEVGQYRFGIFGGYTPGQRRRMEKKNASAV